jgi:hypothetical protein
MSREGTDLLGRPAANEDLDKKVAEHVCSILARKRDRRPLTVGFMQTVAAAIGHKVGEHRAARMVNHLKATKRITQVGRYQAKTHGYYVAIYRLHSYVVSSIRRNSPVKRLGWWQHGLFGNPDGEKPLFAAKKDLRRWKSKTHRALEYARANYEYPAAPPMDQNLWKEVL